MSSTKRVASAILAVYNGEGVLERCLDSLLTQTVKIEIIVVDDGSTDRTLEILKKYPELKVYKQKHGGPSRARNLGVTKSTTDIILFVDSDMYFEENYVRDLIDPIVAKQVIGTYTTNERVSNWNNVWARCWNYQEGWEDGVRFPKEPPLWGTDYRAILKTEFERVGGFDHIGYTDTWSLFHKLSLRPRATRAVCYHQNPGSLIEVFKQARWSAKRPYKYGMWGTPYALIRTSVPCSLVRGLIVSVQQLEFHFLIFKLVYDWGRFVGILEMLTTGNLAK